MQNLKVFTYFRTIISFFVLLACFACFVGFFFLQRTYLNKFRDLNISIIDLEKYLIDYFGITFDTLIKISAFIVLTIALYYLITMILNNWLRKRIKNYKDVKFLCILLTLCSAIPVVLLVMISIRYNRYIGSAPLLIIASINALCGLSYFTKIFKKKY